MTDVPTSEPSRGVSARSLADEMVEMDDDSLRRAGRGQHKSLGLSAELAAYAVAHGMPPDEIAAGLIAETRRVAGPRAGMQVSPDQGAFLSLLVRVVGARRVVEVGTFTGYSALCLARGLPPDGQLICCDINEDWVSVGHPFWERAGIADRIEVRIGPAAETLRSLPTEPTLDLAFIDADKVGYPVYYEELLRRLRPGGLVLVDNVLWSGRVIDPTATDPDTVAIRRFNDAVAADGRVECVMLSIADGLTMARKR